MDPILRTIHYFFKRNGKTLEDDTIESFVENDIKFPEFVALAFQISIKEIPGFKPKPKTSDDKYLNKCHALEYIFNHNENVKKIKPGVESNSLFQIILSCVIIDQCFHINLKQLFSICNFILNTRKFLIEEKDLLQAKCILLLLKVLVDKKIPEDIGLNKFNKTITKIFKKYKIPLVIDDSCFKKEKQFLFLIQIEIILKKFGFSVENNSKGFLYPINFFDSYGKLGTKSSILNIEESGYHDSYVNYKRYKISEQESAIEKNIIDTINGICRKYDSCFSLNSNYIINILNILFKNDVDEKRILQNIRSSPKLNNELIINHLKTKNPKFKTIIFDFENPNYTESSTIMLYTSILDSFFLKKSKEELYDRCYTLLYGKYKNRPPYEDIQRILYDWNTYVTLINFINDDKAKIKLASSKLFRKDKLKNDKKQVPIVISESYFKLCPTYFVPNGIYYQLQFIFDALDKSDFLHRFVEYSLITIRKFSQIEIPSTDTIASSIRAKNISKILQNKRYKKNLQKDKTKNNTESQNNLQEINQTLENNQTRTESKNKQANSQSEHKKESMEFINSSESNKIQQQKKYFFKDGILYEEGYTNGSKTFNNLIKSIQHKEENDVNDIHYEDFSHINHFKYNEKHQPFILFSYDDSNKEWQLNVSIIKKTISMLNENNYKKIPLVFYLESNLKQLLRILNIEDDYIINNNSICIYGYCDYNKTTPLSMFLYVPECKQNLSNINININSIAFQIYFFLSFISGINIVNLDEVKCVKQIKIIQKINNMKNSFNKEINTTLDQINDEYAKNKFTNEFDQENTYLLEKQAQFLILIHDKTHLHNITKDIKKIELFNELNGKICLSNIYDIIYINSSYFYELIQQLTVESSFKPDDLLKIFSFIEFFNMDNDYINWIFNDLKEDDLTTIIKNKINKLIINDDFYIFNPEFNLTNLRKTIYKTFPILDSIYLNKCNELIELKEKFYLDIHQNLINKLKKCYKKYINNIKQLVKNKSCLSDEQIDNIKDGYIDLLKDKFFKIIQKYYPAVMSFTACEKNEDILNSQIKEFTYEINEIFQEVKKQTCETVQEIDLEKGTNYTIREIENEREIKPRIEMNGKLEDLIEQDF